MTDPRSLEAESVLREFLRAFEDCDLAAMQRFFAPDCVSFDQVIAGSTTQDVTDLRSYRRCNGMPPAMRRMAVDLPSRNSGPPYHSLEPKDLLVQTYGDAAVTTFHIETDGILRRRSIVLVKRDGNWRIVHLHASSVQARAGDKRA